MKSIGTILVFMCKLSLDSTVQLNAFIKKHNIEGKLGKLNLDQTGTTLFSLQCIFHYYLNL